MHLVLLPGHSPTNKPWIYQLSTTLKAQFTSTIIQEYNHWSTSGNFSLSQELAKLSLTVQALSSYAVLAKSVGVHLAIEAFNRGIIKPQLCIFLGTTQKSALMLANWPPPTLFIQETKDPLNNFSSLNHTLQSVFPQNYQLVEIPGTNHSYAQINHLHHLIVSYLKKLDSAT